MLRYKCTETIADKIDKPTMHCILDFYNTDTNKNNYIDIFFHVNAGYKQIALKFDLYGTYNYRNNTNLFSASVARINNWASSVCLSNTMVNKGLFISLPKYVDNNTYVVRVWYNDVEPSSFLRFDTRITAFRNNISGGADAEMFKILRMEPGYMERNTFIPMVEGDSIHSFIVNDDDPITISSEVHESNLLNITWPTFNDKYKLVRNLGGSNYVVEYDKRAMMSLYIYNIPSGTTYKLPLALTGYNAFITPVGMVSYTSVKYERATTDGTIKIITGDGTKVSCDVLIYGRYKNPRFSEPNPNLVNYPEILDLPTEKKTTL